MSNLSDFRVRTPFHLPITPRKRGKPKPTTQKDAAALDTLKQLGQTQLPKYESNIHCITIIGQIEGHMVLPAQNKTTKYEHLIPQLVAAEQNPKVQGILVVLNTVGGDVEAGLALAEMIDSMHKPTVSLVLGGGHSIGVPILPMSLHTNKRDIFSL